MKYHLIRFRRDGLGSHFYVNIGNFLFAKLSKLKLICYRNQTYIKNIYFRGILKETQLVKKNKINENRLIDSYEGMRGPLANVVELTKTDVITVFNKTYKQLFFELLKSEIQKRKYQLPWKNSKNVIGIHVRLEDKVKKTVAGKDGDRTHWEDYDGRESFNYIKNLIDHSKFKKFKTENNSLDTQVPIAPEKLENLIIKFKQEYPEKEIYIITYSHELPRWLRKLKKKYQFKIFHNNLDEYDLWLLINTDILVLSKSTFSIVAAFYHQGSKIYYPYWGRIATLGIGSQYDQTNWTGFV